MWCVSSLRHAGLPACLAMTSDDDERSLTHGFAGVSSSARLSGISSAHWRPLM